MHFFQKIKRNYNKKNERKTTNRRFMIRIEFFLKFIPTNYRSTCESRPKAVPIIRSIIFKDNSIIHSSFELSFQKLGN